MPKRACTWCFSSSVGTPRRRLSSGCSSATWSPSDDGALSLSDALGIATAKGLTLRSGPLECLGVNYVRVSKGGNKHHVCRPPFETRTACAPQGEVCFGFGRKDSSMRRRPRHAAPPRTAVRACGSFRDRRPPAWPAWFRERSEDRSPGRL